MSLRAALLSLPLLLFAGTILTGAALAQPSRCSTPPRPPGCLERLGSTADVQAVAYCRAEVNDYRRRMDRYIDCLNDEADRGAAASATARRAGWIATRAAAASAPEGSGA